MGRRRTADRSSSVLSRSPGADHHPRPGARRRGDPDDPDRPLLRETVDDALPQPGHPSHRRRGPRPDRGRRSPAPTVSPRCWTSPTSSCSTSAAPMRSSPSCLLTEAGPRSLRRAARPARGPARGDRARADAPPARRRRAFRTATAAPGSSAGSPADARAAFACICERGPLRADERGRGARLGREPRGARRWTPWPSTAWSGRDGDLHYPAARSHERAAGSDSRRWRSTAPRTAGPTGRRWRPARPEQHLHQPGRLRRRGAVHPVRQQPRPRSRSPGSTPCWKAPRTAIFVASGMGATALAHLAVLRPGDHLISSAWIYGGTQPLLRRGAGPPRHRGDLRRSGPAAALAQVGAEGHPRDLRRDARPIR